MTKLIITRTSEWNNKAREFGIYLNDKKIGVIDDGEKKEFEIEPGIYKINGKIDWCKSQKIEFNITENESKEIEISGFKYGNIIMPIGLGIMLLFFLIKFLFKIESNLKAPYMDRNLSSKLFRGLRLIHLNKGNINQLSEEVFKYSETTEKHHPISSSMKTTIKEFYNS